MPIYSFKAQDKFNNPITGKMEAESEEDLRQILRRNRQTLVSAKKNLDIKIPGFKDKVKSKHLVAFTSQFAAYLEGTMPQDQTLQKLRDQTEPKELKRVIGQLCVAVNQGSSLSEAVAMHPAVFDPMYVGMVRAGEASGELARIFDELATLLENQDEITSKVKSAMIYPGALLSVSVMALAALLYFVIPQFVGIFKESGVELPWPTRFVVGLSDFLHYDWYWIIIVIVGARFAFSRYARTAKGRWQIDSLKFRLPVFGSLNVKAKTAQFCRLMSTMIGSGVRIQDGLELSAVICQNVVLAKAIRKAKSSLEEGQDVASPLRAANIFPQMACNFIESGEELGNFELMLNKAAKYYEGEVNRAIDAALKLIEPAILVVMGGAVAVIMLSIYLPMFGMISTMGKD